VPDFLKIYNRVENFSLGFKAHVNDQEMVFFHYLFSEVELERNGAKEERPKPYTICAVEVTQNFDPILALTRRSLALFGRSDLEKLALEGDFDNYFSILIPKGSEVDALSVLTPDVMEIMVDNGRGIDLEVRDNLIIMSSQDDYLQVAKIDKLLTYMYK
jgi:hypothetical protein